MTLAEQLIDEVCGLNEAGILKKFPKAPHMVVTFSDRKDVSKFTSEIQSHVNYDVKGSKKEGWEVVVTAIPDERGKVPPKLSSKEKARVNRAAKSYKANDVEDSEEL